jgi:hypothetical protein
MLSLLLVSFLPQNHQPTSQFFEWHDSPWNIISASDMRGIV